ncbi:MAG: class I SAM-dependent methyltransferase [Desulfatibacillum sp.]|nr:class I SAM-dependent methyltransferase [Desulfatibacillum sp.]
MAFVKKHFGQEMDRMPGWAFRGMSLIFSIRDRFFPVDSLLEKFPITEGMTVVDYGCGPGSYIKLASRLVGAWGMVYAVDVHELAVAAIEKRVRQEGLGNVRPVLAQKDRCPVEDEAADLVWALDMFHMVSRPKEFLQELNRITKPGGLLYIDDGHQPRKNSKEKIVESGAWAIEEETAKFMKCIPVK